MKKKILYISLAVIMFILALGITAYPLVSSWYNERHQSLIHTQYMENMEQADDSALIRAKELADAYNAALVPGAADEAYSQAVLLAASEDYKNQLNLAGDGIMGFIEIPKIGISLPIYHGTDSDTLEAGVGHLLGSSLPVGGLNTHCVLTAHSGLAGQRMFSDIDTLETDDVFYLEVLGKTLAYQVDQIEVVLPEDTTHLEIEPGEDYCTLVTCTPFGVNTYRLLVRGARIPLEYDSQDPMDEEFQVTERPASTWGRHYLNGILLGLCLVLLTAAIILLARWIWKHMKKKDPGEEHAV